MDDDRASTLYCRGERCSPVKNHKATFLLSYFSVTKSTKSHQRERYPLFENSSRVHELVGRSSAWQVRAIKDKVKVGGFALPAISYYHACEHSARKSRAYSCTHCLHARYKCRAGVNVICTLTGWSYIFCFFCWLCLDFIL